MFNNLENHMNLFNKFIITNPYFDYDCNIKPNSIMFILENEGGVSFGFAINNIISLDQSHQIIKSYNLEQSINSAKDIRIYYGGNCDITKMFILHSSDYRKNILFRVNNKISLSSNLEILNDILNNEGPKDSIIFIGYLKWENNKLEDNIKKYNWIITDYDLDILFCKENELKWQNSLKKLSLSQTNFSLVTGKS